MTAEDVQQEVSHQEGLQELRRTTDPAVINLHASAAQREILRLTRLLQPEVTVTFIVNQEVYMSADAGGWSFLAGAIEVMRGVVQDATFTPIEFKPKSWVDALRNQTLRGGLTLPVPPRYGYHLLSNPISVGFYGTPTTADTAKFTYVRGHTTADNISDDVAPLIPDDHIDLLAVGTILKMFESRLYNPDDSLIGRGVSAVSLKERAVSYFNARYQMLLQSARISRANIGDHPYVGSRRMRF